MLAQKSRSHMPVLIAMLLAMLSAMLLGVPAMILHECGHLAAARACRVKVKKVGISWIGLYILRDCGPRWANLLISFSGPFVNLLLAATLWRAMPGFAEVNLFIGVGSLLPLPKSDGRRILALLSSSDEELSAQGGTVRCPESPTGLEVGPGRLSAT